MKICPSIIVFAESSKIPNTIGISNHILAVNLVKESAEPIVHIYVLNYAIVENAHHVIMRDR